MVQQTHNILGADLSLTRYTGVAGGPSLESADSWRSLDLRVVPGGRGGLRQFRDVQDLSVISGRNNLGQALILRLLTPRGSLAPLGHTSYGSRLVELIGRPNDESTRNLARLFTLQALDEEPRVGEVLNITVDVSTDRPDVIRIGFSVLPLNDDQALALGLEISL